MNEVKWTKTKPRIPGFYWYRNSEAVKPEIIELFTNRNLTLDVKRFGFNIQNQSKLMGQFAGPIQPPTEYE